MLYEMLSGRVPFDDPTLAGLLLRHLDEPPTPLAIAAPDRKIPPALDALVLRLMAKKPADRFPSMQVVAQALEPLLSPPVVRSHSTRAAAILATVLGGSLLLLGMLAQRLHIVHDDAVATLPLPSSAELVTAQQQARDVLRQQLLGPERAQRLAALSAVAQCRDATFTSNLETLSSDPDPELAVHAAAALGTMGDRHALPTLRRLLDRTPLPGRLGIARALADLGDERGQATLSSVLRSRDRAELRLQAAFLLCDAEEPAAQQLLFDLAELSTTPARTGYFILPVLTPNGLS